MKRLALPLLLALVFAACDSNDADDRAPLARGAFQASATFDDGEQLDLSGFASASSVRVFFADSLFFPGDSLGTTDSLVSSTGFMITLVDAADGPLPGQFARTISFLLRDAETRTPGSYPIGGFDRNGVIASVSALNRSGGLGVSYASGETGTLTIDTVTEERTSGSFSFRADYAPLRGDDVRSVTVSGRFDARTRDVGALGGDGPGGFTPLFP